jgi:hypothetical protein
MDSAVGAAAAEEKAQRASESESRKCFMAACLE